MRGQPGAPGGADTLHRNATQTYDALIAAGFTDAWAALHPADLAGGLTWGHDELLADPDTVPVWRIDLVLFRGTRFGATQAEAIDIVQSSRRKDGRWSLQHSYKGKTYFELEQLGAPSRWNTLRALRVLKWWDGRA